MIGGFIDMIAGGGYGEAQDLSRENLRDIQNLPLPVLKEYYPELYQQIGFLAPELEQAVNLGPSKMEGISTDPALRQAQLNALDKLSGIGAAGGMDAQFLSNAAQLQNDINTNLQGQTGAIEQNLATRGMSGGMSELVSKQLAAQQAANRQAQMGLDFKAQAEQRQLDALIKSGQLGGQMQAQDFGQKSQVASAQDQIARFNAANTQDVMSRNVGAKNQAQSYNLGVGQDVANKNVGSKNEAKGYNLNLAQQQYDNELKKRGLMSGARQDLANQYRGEADRNVGFVGNLISSGSKYAGGA